MAQYMSDMPEPPNYKTFRKHLFDVVMSDVEYSNAIKIGSRLAKCVFALKAPSVDEIDGDESWEEFEIDVDKAILNGVDMYDTRNQILHNYDVTTDEGCAIVKERM